jgi:O-antigen/teichoic acid export membrane protein
LSVRRNTIYGAVGFALPTAVVFLAYPLVLSRLGATQMGVYILAVSLSGTFGFLEFGLTTITTKLVAEAVAARDPARASDAVITSLAFYIALGATGMLALWIVAPALARWAGAADVSAAVVVFRVAAVLLLSVYVNNVASAVLKGLHRFDVATLQGTFLSLATWGGALIAVLGGGGLVAVAFASLTANALMIAVSGIVTTRLCDAAGVHLWNGRPSLATLRPMLRLGAFMSLNGVAGVLTNQVQSFIMARALSTTAVTVWGTAVQIVSKINALTSAAFEVVLPTSAQLVEPSARSDAGLRTLRSIYLKALGLALAASTSASAVLYVAAPSLIRLWLHSPIDAEVTLVLRILCVGVAVNGATPVAFHLLNGIGRPGVNTAFMGAGILMLYGALLLLWFGGLTVPRFALATSLSLIVNGALFLAYCEFVVWRRWLLRGIAVHQGA